jgi:hypothetical protein
MEAADVSQVILTSETSAALDGVGVQCGVELESQGARSSTDMIARLREKVMVVERRVQEWLVIALLSRSVFLRRKLMAGGEISEYFDWQLAKFGTLKTVASQLLLWEKVSARMRASGEQWHVIELGVAFGDATRWWLSHHDETVISTWDGFDRFTGLPRSWRGLPAGTFNANGKTPSIDDRRIVWHVGDIENTVDKIDLSRISSGRRLIYFDFDLYEPSKVAWDWLSPHLSPGDILYFDEAIDGDERRLLNESVVPSGIFDCIGTTSLQLAIEVQSINGD